MRKPNKSYSFLVEYEWMISLECGNFLLFVDQFYGESERQLIQSATVCWRITLLGIGSEGKGKKGKPTLLDQCANSINRYLLDHFLGINHLESCRDGISFVIQI